MKVSKGSVFKRKDSQFLYINLSVDGKRIVQKTKYKPEEIDKVKEEILPLVRAKILSGEITLEKPTKEEEPQKTFTYYSNFFIRVKEKIVKPNTIRSYRDICRRFALVFGDTDVDQIRPSDIKKYLLDKKIKVSSMRIHLTVLSDVFNEALFDEVITSNPCSKVKLGKKEDTQIYPFDKEEVQTILNSSSDNWFINLLATAFYTGARSGELFALKWRNIDLEKMRIYIDSTRGQYAEGKTKTNKARYVPIFDILLPYLKSQRKITGLREYVFLTDTGKHLNPTNIIVLHWKPLLKRLNIPYRNIYTTRHTFATTLLSSGNFSLNQVAAILGHTNISTLIQHYNKYIESEVDKINTRLNPFCNDFCHEASQTA